MTGADLRALREARGWTQAELAARLGVSANHLSRMERGIRNVTPTVALLAGRLAGRKGAKET